MRSNRRRIESRAAGAADVETVGQNRVGGQARDVLDVEHGVVVGGVGGQLLDGLGLRRGPGRSPRS